MLIVSIVLISYVCLLHGEFYDVFLRCEDYARRLFHVNHVLSRMGMDRVVWWASIKFNGQIDWLDVLI